MTQSERQQNSLQILKDSVATLHETEEVIFCFGGVGFFEKSEFCVFKHVHLFQVGNNIMTDLSKQKETIKHARGNLKTTNADLKFSVSDFLIFFDSIYFRINHRWLFVQGKLVNKMSKWWRG